jgi:hypothetical protein
MNIGDVVYVAWELLKGIVSSTAFVLILFIGFCVVVGFTKTKRTAGKVAVVRSLDERITNRSVEYLLPTAPRGPADQLKAPELVEAAARK